MEEVTVPKPVTCRRCTYTWTPRISGTPRECPYCKRHDWNVENPMSSRRLSQIEKADETRRCRVRLDAAKERRALEGRIRAGLATTPRPVLMLARSGTPPPHDTEHAYISSGESEYYCDRVGCRVNMDKYVPTGEEPPATDAKKPTMRCPHCHHTWQADEVECICPACGKNAVGGV